MFFTVYTQQVHQHKAKPTQCDTTKTAQAVDACSSPDRSHPRTLPPARRTEPAPTDTMPTPTSNPENTNPPPSPAGGSEEATGADAPPSLETRRRGRARRRSASTPAGEERAVKRWRSDECHELLKGLQQTSDHRENLQARNDVTGLNAQYQAAADHLAGRFPQYTRYRDARVKSKAQYLQTAWNGLRKVINAERNRGAGTERIETLQGVFALLLSLLTPLSTCVSEELWLDFNSMFPVAHALYFRFRVLSSFVVYPSLSFSQHSKVSRLRLRSRSLGCDCGGGGSAYAGIQFWSCNCPSGKVAVSRRQQSRCFWWTCRGSTPPIDARAVGLPRATTWKCDLHGG